jgi:hypothetical protein
MIQGGRGGFDPQAATHRTRGQRSPADNRGKALRSVEKPSDTVSRRRRETSTNTPVSGEWEVRPPPQRTRTCNPRGRGAVRPRPFLTGQE